MKCPVCSKHSTSIVCPKCGFDSSRDYGKYPTFGIVGRVTSVSALRKQWQDSQKPVAASKPEQPVIPESPQKKNRLLPLLIAAGFVMTLGLGIWIGSGLGDGKPAEPGESVQMQEPIETQEPVDPQEPSKPEDNVQTQAPPETTKSIETDPLKTEDLVLSWSDYVFTKQDMLFAIDASLGGKRLNRSEIIWSTSDPAVATVNNGKVTAVGEGECFITASYAGQEATCRVFCKFDIQGSSNSKVNFDEVNLSVGNSFSLSLIVDKIDGNELYGTTSYPRVDWTMSTEDIVAITNDSQYMGVLVTGLNPGTVTLTTTYEEEIFTCIVHVK